MRRCTTNLGLAVLALFVFHVGCKDRQAQVKDADAHFERGSALSGKGGLNGTIAEYREAVRLDPDNDVMHDMLGMALEEKGDQDGSIAEYRQAIRLKPDNQGAHDNLGRALRKKGDYDASIAEIREAIRLKPDDAGSHYNLGSTLDKKGVTKVPSPNTAKRSA
jgi:Flp pilus assembly protein TadD